MAGWAQTIIVGNVGKDPEARYLPSGVPVTSFSVAVSRKWTDKNTNERKEKTVWYRVTCWRQLAETASNYVTKGAPIMVVGSVEARAWKDNAGEPQASLELTADTFQLLGRRDDDGGMGSGGRSGGSYEEYGEPASDNISDIPF